MLGSLSESVLGEGLKSPQLGSVEERTSSSLPRRVGINSLFTDRQVVFLQVDCYQRSSEHVLVEMQIKHGHMHSLSENSCTGTSSLEQIYTKKCILC